MYRIRDSAMLVVDFCRSCSAIWHDHGELERRVGVASLAEVGSVAATPDASKKNCPRCSDAPLFPWASRDGAARDIVRGVLVCRQCQGAWVTSNGLEQLRAALRSARTAVPSLQRAKTPPQAGKAAKTEVEYMRVQTGWRGNLLPPVAVIGAAFLLDKTGIGQLLCWFLGMFLHEGGHALAGWLGGRVAIPTPFGATFFIGSGRLRIISVVLLLVFAGTMLLGLQRRLYLLATLAVVAATATFYLAFVVPERSGLEFFILAGGAGQITLSAALICLYPWQAPKGLRWDFWRYPALVLGSLVFVDAFRMWELATTNPLLAPHGSAVGGDGDLERLKASFGWTEASLINFFWDLCLASATAIALVYLVSVLCELWRANRLRATQSSLDSA